MDAQTLFDTHSNTTFPSTLSPVYHIITGSFRSVSLFLLAFSPLHGSLKLVQTVPGDGPHQYLATNQHRDRVYATSWADPPALHSWEVRKPSTSLEAGNSDEHMQWKLHGLGKTPKLAAISSYISLPPPFTHLYSAGGPTGEVHKVDPSTGGFGEKVQQYLFIPEDELDKADKSAKALRYGSHAVEISSKGHAFIPVLGDNIIKMYTVDRDTGTLTFLSDNTSPRPKDGPRHVVVNSEGSILYSVTEHTSFIDVYQILPTSLSYIYSTSILPPSLQNSTEKFRGDTLRLAPPTPYNPTSRYLFATTRGGKEETRGWLTIIPLSPTGTLRTSASTTSKVLNIPGTEHWETPTSGCKANAIDLRSMDNLSEGVWITLTDDSPGRGAVRILEWLGEGKGAVRIVADYPGYAEEGECESEGGGERIEGASHAIWVS